MFCKNCQKKYNDEVWKLLGHFCGGGVKFDSQKGPFVSYIFYKFRGVGGLQLL